MADHVVDCYQPIVAGLENDIDEIEDEVFSGSATVSRRIYELTREVIEFQRATKPLAGILGELIELPGVDDEERRYLRDVQDHAMRIEERVDGFRVLLQNILSVHLTLETKALNEVSVNQNEQVQKISAWAAILFAPTLIGTIYGMNFTNMPELDWRLGYPMALGLMLARQPRAVSDLQAPPLDLTGGVRSRPGRTGRVGTLVSTLPAPSGRKILTDARPIPGGSAASRASVGDVEARRRSLPTSKGRGRRTQPAPRRGFPFGVFEVEAAPAQSPFVEAG